MALLAQALECLGEAIADKYSAGSSTQLHLLELSKICSFDESASTVPASLIIPLATAATGQLPLLLLTADLRATCVICDDDRLLRYAILVLIQSGRQTLHKVRGNEFQLA